MKFLRRLNRTVKPLVDLQAGLDIERNQRQLKTVTGLVKAVFTPIPTPAEPESFDHAVDRLNLKQQDVTNRIHEFRNLALIMFLLFMGMFLYTLYSLFNLNWFPVVVGLSISGVLLALTFRYHFWYFQAKHHKLGCTFREYWQQAILGKKL